MLSLLSANSEPDWNPGAISRTARRFVQRSPHTAQGMAVRSSSWLPAESRLPGAVDGDPDAAPQVSVVVPLLDEAGNVGTLCDRVVESMEQLGRTFEVILVDDGSTDATFPELLQRADRDDRLKLVRLRRNYGQTAALSAGFDYARGQVIVPMDGDLQNDPHDIGTLLEKIDEGYDVVSGWRKDRQDGLVRRLPSRTANWLIALVTGVRLHDYGCTLKAYRADVIRELRLYGEMHRFLPAIAHQAGARITEVPVDHHSRVAGKSKYGLGRTFKVLIDLLTVKFLSVWSTKPSHVFGGSGLLLCFTGSLFIHELTEVRPGAALDYLDAVRTTRAPLLAEYGHTLVGLWEVLLNDYEVCTVWATEPRHHVRLAKARDVTRGVASAADAGVAGDERLEAWHRLSRQWATRWREELMTPAAGTLCGPAEAPLDDSVEA